MIRMSDEKIHERLNEMHRGEKSKKFLNHLIRAYFPVGKIEKVWDKPKGKFKCAISGAPLLSVAEAYEVMSGKEYFEKTMAHIKSGFSESSEKLEHPAVDAFKGKVMGVTTEDTDTFLSIPVYHILYEWLVAKLLSGDKHISWLMRQIQGDMFFNQVGKMSGGEQTEQDINRVKKAFNKPKKATFGDLEALQRLKSQLEEKEKKK